MNDPIPAMRIMIACRDSFLRNTIFSLLAYTDPANIKVVTGTLTDDWVESLSDGWPELIIIDQTFQHDGVTDCIGDLQKTRLPIVALMPGPRDGYAAYVAAVAKTWAVKLDLPTTVAGLQIAMKAAVDRQERAGATSGPDYDREKAWPHGLVDPVDQAERQFQDDQEIRELATKVTASPFKLTPIGLVEGIEREAQSIRVSAVRIATAASHLAIDVSTDYGLEPRVGVVGRPPNLAEPSAAPETEDPQPPDPMDEVIEAAKAIVNIAAVRALVATSLGHVTPSTLTIDSAHFQRLYDALVGAGYGEGTGA